LHLLPLITPNETNKCRAHAKTEPPRLHSIYVAQHLGMATRRILCVSKGHATCPKQQDRPRLHDSPLRLRTETSSDLIHSLGLPPSNISCLDEDCSVYFSGMCIVTTNSILKALFKLMMLGIKTASASALIRWDPLDEGVVYRTFLTLGRHF